MHHINSVIRDKRDKRDIKIEDFRHYDDIVRKWDNTVPPKTFMLDSEILPDVVEQGKSSVCVALALCGAKRIQEFIERKQKVDLSALYIYNRRENKPIHGMSIRDGLEIIRKQGTVMDGYLPFDFGNIDGDESGIPETAERFKINAYARIGSLREIKLSLMFYCGVIASVPMYNTGDSFFIKRRRNRFLGRHAILIVGWDEDGLIFMNSWGDDWGKNGYGKIPYEFINISVRPSKDKFEFWVMLDDDNISKDRVKEVRRFKDFHRIFRK